MNTELHALERKLAYQAARSDIECFLVGTAHSGQHYGKWHDVTTVEAGVDQEFVEDAVRYLTLRKLLKRHPENPNLVRPMNESRKEGAKS